MELDASHQAGCGCAVPIGGVISLFLFFLVLGPLAIVPAIGVAALGYWALSRVRWTHTDAEETADPLDAEIAALRAMGTRAGSADSRGFTTASRRPAGITAEPRYKAGRVRIADLGEFGPILKRGRAKLSFTYCDVDGVVTERLVSPWTEHAAHVEGHCHLRGERRTFRKDRVLAWRTGKDALVDPRFD